MQQLLTPSKEKQREQQVVSPQQVKFFEKNVFKSDINTVSDWKNTRKLH
jgi:hypothetical protein